MCSTVSVTRSERGLPKRLLLLPAAATKQSVPCGEHGGRIQTVFARESERESMAADQKSTGKALL
jgi:hypothetical protein